LSPGKVATIGAKDTQSNITSKALVYQPAKEMFVPVRRSKAKEFLDNATR